MDDERFILEIEQHYLYDTPNRLPTFVSREQYSCLAEPLVWNTMRTSKPGCVAAVTRGCCVCTSINVCSYFKCEYAFVGIFCVSLLCVCVCVCVSVSASTCVCLHCICGSALCVDLLYVFPSVFVAILYVCLLCICGSDLCVCMCVYQC